MDTFELEKMIWNITSEKNLSKEQLMEAYEDLGNIAVSNAVEKQALMEAAAQVLSEEQAGKITVLLPGLIHDHRWRMTPEEDEEILRDYGYEKPVSLIDEVYAIGLLQSNEHGGPHINVLLLNKDGTEKEAQTIEEVTEHTASGGLLGVSTFEAEYIAAIEEEINREAGEAE